jgi:oligopeptide/dipeptide ABC transporter ATP-binding protein
MKPLLHIEKLTKVFRQGRHSLRAVDDVSFEIYPGETVGLVGESSCGKTTTARCIMGLDKPTSGHILFDGLDVTALGRRQMRRQRRWLQMVFQDPDASLNPRFTVRRILTDPLGLVRREGRSALEARLQVTMERVGIPPAYLNRYPHQLSGGQKQRVGIARAIIINPKFVALDEPTSSLDMSIRIHVLSLLKRLQEELGITYLLISHDLSSVRSLSGRVLVMYLGRLVEAGPVETVFDQPYHPYTRALMSAIPVPEPGLKRKRIVLPGEPPDPFNVPPGCAFYERCAEAQAYCYKTPPQLREAQPGHLVACHLSSE